MKATAFDLSEYIRISKILFTFDGLIIWILVKKYEN